MEHISVRQYESPIGKLLIGSYKEKLVLLDYYHRKMRLRVDKRLQKGLAAEFREESTAVTEEAVRQLNEYLRGQRRQFDISIQTVGTPFQQRVWQALMSIPYGEVISYGELSRRINAPGAVRAVAAANGANALSIIIPCHRVIGSNGKLTGYAGGLDVKKKLLGMETLSRELFS